MAIATTLTLPNQPADGSVVYVPLGGDGWRSPMSSYSVTIRVTGDASGGTNQITVSPDPQFVAIVSYVQVASPDSPNDPEDFLVSLNSGQETAQTGMQIPSVLPAGNNTNTAIWTPPLTLLDPPRGDPSIVAAMQNINTIDLELSFRLYNFRKGVAQRTPLGRLVAALPRPSITTL